MCSVNIITMCNCIHQEKNWYIESCAEWTQTPSAATPSSRWSYSLEFASSYSINLQNHSSQGDL